MTGEGDLTVTVQSARGLSQIEETLMRFTGTDKTYPVSKWVEEMDDNAEIFGWTATQKLLIARRSLVGAAALWLKSEKTFKTYDDLKKALMKEFPDNVNVKEIHEMMASRKKRNDETCYEYMLVMKELGKRGGFPDYVAIQYIVDGIEDFESNKIMLYGVSTYSKLKENLAVYEKMKSKEIESLAVRFQPAKAARIERNCYKCGDKNHIASSCRNGVKCFKCDTFGHIAPDCQASNMTTNSNTARSETERDGRCSGSAGESGEARAQSWQHPLSMLVYSERDFEDVSETFVGKEASTDDFYGGDSSCQQCQRQRCQNCRNCQCHEISRQVEINSLPKVNNSVKILEIGSVTFACLVDSGSDFNLLSADLFFELNVTPYAKDSTVITGLGSVKVSALGKCSTVLQIDNHCYELMFCIVPKDVTPYKIILGRPMFDLATVVFDKGQVSIKPQGEDMSVQCLLAGTEQVVSCVPDAHSSKGAPRLGDSYNKSVQTQETAIPMTGGLNDDILKEQQVVEQQIGECMRKGSTSRCARQKGFNLQNESSDLREETSALEQQVARDKINGPTQLVSRLKFESRFVGPCEIQVGRLHRTMARFMLVER